MDGYGVKYTGEFYDVNDRYIKVSIYGKAYAGASEELVLEQDALVLYVNTQKLTHTVYGMGAKLSVVNTSGDIRQYNDLFATARREHYMKVEDLTESTAEVLFEGFILPEMYSQSIRKFSRVTITASNGLNELKNYIPPSLQDETVNFIKLIDLVKECIWSTDLDSPIYIKIGLWSDDCVSAYDIDEIPFDYTYVDRQVFIENGEYLKADFILSEILKPLYCRVYYENEKWVIDRIKDIPENDYKVYQNDSAETESTTTIVRAEKELSDDYLLFEAGNLTYSSGHNKYNVELTFNRYANLIHSIYAIQFINDVGNPLRMPRYQWRAWLFPGIQFVDANVGVDFLEQARDRENPVYSRFASSLIENAVMYSRIREEDVSDVEYLNYGVSTFIPVDFESQASLSVKISYEFNPKNLAAGARPYDNFYGGFRLRYLVSSDSTGDVWRYITLNAQDRDVPLITYLIDHVDFPLDTIGDWEGSLVFDEDNSRLDLMRRGVVLFRATSVTDVSLADIDDLTFNGVASLYTGLTLKFRKMQDNVYGLGVTSPEFGTWDSPSDNLFSDISGFYYMGRGMTESVRLSLTNYGLTVNEAMVKEPLLNVNVSIPIGELADVLVDDFGDSSGDTDLPEILNLYLDIMPSSVRYFSAHWVRVPYFPTVWGDVVVTVSGDVPANLITGFLNEDFEQPLDYKLKVYDGRKVNFKNALYYFDGLEYQRTRSWNDRTDLYGRRLQHVLINSLVQQFNSPRYMIDADVKVKTAGARYSMGDILRFYFLDGDSSAEEKRFILTGWMYNVKRAVYKLYLDEFKPDDGWEFDSPAADLVVAPATLTAFYNATTSLLEITSNRPWIARVTYDSGQSFWLGLSQSSGDGDSGVIVYLFAVTQDSQATITVTTEDAEVDTCVITRQQTPSTPLLTLSDTNQADFIPNGTACSGAVFNVTLDDEDRTWSAYIVYQYDWNDGWLSLSQNDGEGSVTGFTITCLSATTSELTRNATVYFEANGVIQAVKTVRQRTGACV